MAATPKRSSGPSRQATETRLNPVDRKTRTTKISEASTIFTKPTLVTVPRKTPAQRSIGSTKSTGQTVAEQFVRLDREKVLRYEHLRIWAESYYDTQDLRKKNGNRLGAARRRNIDTSVFEPSFVRLVLAEEDLGRDLEEAYKRVAPPGILEWEKNTMGVGPLSLGRVLGHLGHPRHAFPHHYEGTGKKRKLINDPERPRTLGELWQYAGHGDQSRLSPGMSAEYLAHRGVPMLKMCVYLVSLGVIKEPKRDIKFFLIDQTASTPRAAKQLKLKAAKAMPKVKVNGSEGFKDPAKYNIGPATWHYRQVYEARRIATLGRVHALECKRCGPSGHPKGIGTPWSDAHANADALRIVGKEILKDLWLAATD